MYSPVPTIKSQCLPATGNQEIATASIRVNGVCLIQLGRTVNSLTLVPCAIITVTVIYAPSGAVLCAPSTGHCGLSAPTTKQPAKYLRGFSA